VAYAKIRSRLLGLSVNVCPGVHVGGGFSNGDLPRLNAELHLRFGYPASQRNELILHLCHQGFRQTVM
jgi:hypothetical protein